MLALYFINYYFAEVFIKLPIMSTRSFLCSSILFEPSVVCVLFLTFHFFPLICIILPIFMLNSYVILSSSVLIVMRSFCNSSQLASGMTWQKFCVNCKLSFIVYGYVAKQRRMTLFVNLIMKITVHY